MGEKLCPWPSVRSPTPPLCFCRRIERWTCAQCPLVTRVQITACSRDLQKCVCVYVIVSLFRWAILKRKFGLTHRSYRPRGSQRLLPPPTSPARLPWQELSRCLWSPGTARRCNQRRTIDGERKETFQPEWQWSLLFSSEVNDIWRNDCLPHRVQEGRGESSRAVRSKTHLLNWSCSVQISNSFNETTIASGDLDTRPAKPLDVANARLEREVGVWTVGDPAPGWLHHLGVSCWVHFILLLEAFEKTPR